MIETLIVIFGLALFELISSVDNAIVGAGVLKTVAPRYRRFYLTWGVLFGVFVVRGVLPFMIVYLAQSGKISVWQAAVVAFSDPTHVAGALQQSKPLLLLGGGVYLVFIFLAWLFLEEKKYAFLVESFIHRQAVWFYAVASVFITVVIYLAVHSPNPLLALSATLGSTAYFLTEGFRRYGADAEEKLQNPNLSAWAKLVYLELLDASFSTDGVIGAFAFTLSVPLILVGNGIGAVIVRVFTVRGIDLVTKFAYLKNGAMYSIGVLGMIMVLESFGQDLPFWFAPLNTLVLLVVFLGLSMWELRLDKRL